MPQLPDFNELRYLNEVRWFLNRQEYGYNHFTGSYAGERTVWSQILPEELLAACGQSRDWITDKTVVTMGRFSASCRRASHRPSGDRQS